MARDYLDFATTIPVFSLEAQVLQKPDKEIAMLSIPSMSMLRHGSKLLLTIITLLFITSFGAVAAEAPRAGGELVFAVAETPPSFDGHRETTFAMLHPIAPHYSTLLRFDPHNYPKIIGDVAERWSASKDGLTVTFKLRKGIKFHDGTPLTAQDVKATYDKIIFPAEGVASARKASYAMVDKIESADELTVVFKLKHIAASFLANLASPWNFIYSAEKLKKDPRWYEKNVLGSGPFVFGEYVAGSHWTGKKYSNYHVAGRPYLDSYRAVFIRDTAPRVAAVRSGQVSVEFRGFNPAARDDVVKSLGNKALVQESPWACNLMVVFNNEKKPFNDPRVRRALNLAIDRNEASKALSQISVMKFIGGLYRPGSEFATPPAELDKLPGFGKNINGAREEAKRLLRESGVADGFSFVLKNRNVREPYEITGVFVVDQWRKLGLNVTHTPQESGAYFNDFRQGNFDAGIDFMCEFMDEPDLYLVKYLSSDKSPINYARYKDPTIDELYERQSRMLDIKDRRPLLRQIERRVFAEQNYQFPVLWWQRIVPHHERLKGWKIGPSHYVNQDLRDVWVAQ